MKRILLLLLVLTLSLSVLFGCQLLNKDDTQGTPNEDNTQNEDKPDGGDEVVDYLPDAVRFLHNIYKDATKITARDFDVVGQVNVDGVKFPVTWTCDNDKISIRPSVSDATAYTVDLPSINTEEFSYVLTATISDDKGNSEQRSYEFTVPVLAGIETELEEGVAYKISFNQLKLGKRLFALNKSQNDQNKFILATNDPKEAPDFYAEKVAEGGYKFYTEIDGVKTYIYAKTETAADGKVSKFVGFSAEEGSVFFYEECGAWRTNINGLDYGFGTYNEFDTLSISDWSYFTASSVGTSQFVAEFITSEYAETLAPEETPEVEEPADGSTLTIPEANELGLKVIGGSKGRFYITGKVVEIKNTTYGNMYIADENGNKLYIYGTYDATGANRFDVMENQPKVGDTVTIYGQLSNFNGEAQVKNGWVTSLVPGESGTDTPVDPNPETPTFGVVDPVAGTAYKFGMVQQNVGTDVYYLIGGMDGYYMATGTDANAAIDVYLEETEGGYYLYTLDAAGAKLYINMVVSGTHVNGAYEATASTVYTYDATNKTIIANVTPEGGEAADYWFGTRNDKTYTTVGPCAVSYAGFYCQFYGETEGGNTDTPVDPNPETPTFGVVDPVAGTAYKFGMVQQNVGTDVYYLIGGMNGYYMATGTDVNAAIDVYLEETEGGYYLYTLDAAGAKLYINMVVSGTHVNGAYEATASTVYTYDATNKTIIANVTPEGGEAADYWFGTRNDKTYTTVGPCAVSYAGFYCQFYGETEGGNTDTPVDPDPETPVDPNPEVPTGVTTIPDALAAADGTNAVISGVVISAEAWNTQYNNMSVTIKDAEGNTIYIFRLATQVGLGDTITVTGVVGSYNDAKQIAAGATAVIDVVHGDNHTYANGVCTVCGSKEPVAGETTVKCDFSTLATGTQYADESNTFGDVTVSTHNKGCHFNTQLRLYDSSSNDGWAIVNAGGKVFTNIKINMGYKAATLNVYGSVDGETWVLVQAVSTSTSYVDYTVSIDSAAGYKYLKLDASGAQIRIASIEVTYQG